jgi:hypothetical protein
MGQPPPLPPRPAGWEFMAKPEGESQSLLTTPSVQAQSISTGLPLVDEARIMFLNKFQDRPLSAEEIVYYDSDDGWTSALDCLPSDLAGLYESDGLIEEYTPHTHLQSLMNGLLTVAMLKEALSSLGRKTTGKKSDLIDRLIEADKDAAISMLPTCPRWGVTVMGKSLVDKYRAMKKLEREKLEDDLLRLISGKLFLQASKRRADYNSQQVFPPGLGCSWEDWDNIRDARILDAIWSLTPEALSARASDSLDASRSFASLQYLMGGALSARLCNLIPHTNATAIEARLLSSFAINRVRIEDWKNSTAVEFVKILDCGSDSCDFCNSLSKGVYPINEVPELPCKLCSHPLGCRCVYVTGSFQQD